MSMASLGIGFYFMLIGVLLILTGLFCLIRTYHMLKIVIGIELSMKAVTLFLLLAGYISGNVNLAQIYIITVIVIEVVVTLVAAGIAIRLYNRYGSMDIRNLRNLKG